MSSLYQVEQLPITALPETQACFAILESSAVHVGVCAYGHMQQRTACGVKSLNGGNVFPQIMMTGYFSCLSRHPGFHLIIAFDEARSKPRRRRRRRRRHMHDIVGIKWNLADRRLNHHVNMTLCAALPPF